MGPLNERKEKLEAPIFHFHDIGRKGTFQDVPLAVIYVPHDST